MAVKVLRRNNSPQRTIWIEERIFEFMGVFDILLTGIGLSMDAAAVGMSNGLNEPKMRFVKILLIALFFGVFQGVMPLIGYYAGSLFAEAVASVAPWVALVLLGFIGGKMIYEALSKKGKEDGCQAKPLASAGLPFRRWPRPLTRLPWASVCWRWIPAARLE